VAFVDEIVLYSYTPTFNERSEVDAWITVNNCATIAGITVSTLAVTIAGVTDRCAVKSGAATRQGDLTDELTDALMTLRQALQLQRGAKSSVRTPFNAQ
jgi:hypothetical protein